MKSAKSRNWKFGWCEYLEISRTLLVHKERVKMEAKPLDVLVALLEHPDRVILKEDLLAAVWENTTDQSLATAISKLRRVFGGSRDDIILNVPGRGYRMAVPVSFTTEEERLPSPVHLEIGSRIPKRFNWRAVEQLGGDDDTPVWLAKHDKTGEKRVYKFASDGVRLRALQREVTVGRLLQQTFAEQFDSFVKIFDWDFEQEPFFTESEFVGSNLLQFASTDHFIAMSETERLAVAASLADAVVSIHSAGILHNDLKATNVLLRSNVSAEGVASAVEHQAWTPALADFGVSSVGDLESLRRLDISDHGAFDSQLEAKGPSSVGTAMYRAPELHSGGRPTVQADIYSLGVLLYQIVTGDFQRIPVAGWEVKIADPLIRQDIAQAANIDAASRFASAADLARSLHAIKQRRLDLAKKESADEEVRQIEEALAKARTRRPWVIAATMALFLGLALSLWSYHRAAGERDAAKRENQTLHAMYTFLAQDLIGQSDPSSGVAGSDQIAGQTLVGAISTALPQVDLRFAQEPEIAARLHETIADSLRARTRFPEADQQYEIAAEDFRKAGGTLSQEAIVAELKRESTLMASLLPGAVEKAAAGFARQEKLIAQVDRPTPELQAWQSFVDSGLLGLGPDPKKAIPPLTIAIQKAQTIPGFDSSLLIKMKARFCGLYVRLGDGPKLEQTARDLISELSGRYGAKSSTLVSYEMYLQEAYYLEGDYEKTIVQGQRNFERFKSLLGMENQYTLATLANRAAAEAQLGRYSDAVNDDLSLYDAELSNPSGERMKEGSLNDAALFECHLGRFQSGIGHARQVIRATGPGSAAQPLFFNSSMYIVAECLVAQQETVSRPDRLTLREAASLLEKVHPETIVQLSGEDEYPGYIDIASARLALLRKDYRLADALASRAGPYLTRGSADPYEKKELARVESQLAAHSLRR